MTNFRHFTLAWLVATSPLSSACYVEAYPAPVVAYGYEPAYYDGYVVYYDSVGRPYYFVDGRPVWVMPGAVGYAGLVQHWRVYREPYGRWYAYGGYRYRGYRRR